ncbi:hypothetical protein ACFY3E_42050 [Streptomyces griseorubiginosus]|uniref:hypothetical protein n=1 Tax=Streptomyces griseorubiginosus TaxID=67304 RepID=UPI0036AA24DC
MRPDTTRWQAAVETHVRARGFRTVVESALADPDAFHASSTRGRPPALEQAPHTQELTPRGAYACGLEVKATRRISAPMMRCLELTAPFTSKVIYITPCN